MVALGPVWPLRHETVRQTEARGQRWAAKTVALRGGPPDHRRVRRPPTRDHQETSPSPALRPWQTEDDGTDRVSGRWIDTAWEAWTNAARRKRVQAYKIVRWSELLFLAISWRGIACYRACISVRNARLFQGSGWPALILRTRGKMALRLAQMGYSPLLVLGVANVYLTIPVSNWIERSDRASNC